VSQLYPSYTTNRVHDHRLYAIKVSLLLALVNMIANLLWTFLVYIQKAIRQHTTKILLPNYSVVRSKTVCFQITNATHVYTCDSGDLIIHSPTQWTKTLLSPKWLP